MIYEEQIESVNIVSAMIGVEDCESIKLALEQGELDVSMTYIEPVCEVEYEGSVVWGLEEGNFKDSLGDWTTTGISGEDHVFSYSPDGTNIGAYATGSFQIESPTFCNGTAIMDFDYFTTQGDEDIFDNLIAPFTQYSADLISPRIDLSNVNEPVVEFYHFYVPLNGTCKFYYSIDDGENWIEEYEFEASYIVSSWIDLFPTTLHASLPIGELAGQENVRLKFEALDNDFYTLLIDDVIIRGNTISSADELQEEKESFLVFPNPTQDKLIITNQKEVLDENTKLTLLDLQGNNLSSKLISTFSSNNLELDCSLIPSGVYFLSLENRVEH